MTLIEIIKSQGPVLTKKAPWIDGVAALAALAEIESRFGERNVPKYEAGYDWRGKYASSALLSKFGAMAACSWSSWQLMYPVAVELGCTLRPHDLQNDEVAILWVMEYIDKRIIQKGCTSMIQFFDAYNSGSFRDSIVPGEYIDKGLKSYATVVARRNLGGV